MIKDLADFFKGLISAFFFGLRDLVNGINNTIWGLLIVFWSIHIVMAGGHDPVGYYFAGIGSTLLGVSQHGQTSTITNSTVKLPAPINQGDPNA